MGRIDQLPDFRRRMNRDGSFSGSCGQPVCEDCQVQKWDKQMKQVQVQVDGGD